MEKIKELSIKEEQAIHMRILRIFDDVAKKENIRYFLAYGTLLGAVREHGFIDWDDDIDLWMPRADMEKFSEIFPRYFDEKKYFLQTHKTDKNAVIPEIMRICVADTYKWPEGCENEKFNTGLYFDIFPLDYGYGTEQDLEDIKKCDYYHGKLMWTLKQRRSKTLKGFAATLIGRLMPRKYYIKKMVQLIDKHRDCKSDIMISFPAAYIGLRGCYFKTSFFKAIEYISFEDMQLPIPKDYDAVLRYIYGDDYMTPRVTKPHRVIAYLTQNSRDV